MDPIFPFSTRSIKKTNFDTLLQCGGVKVCLYFTHLGFTFRSFKLDRNDSSAKKDKMKGNTETICSNPINYSILKIKFNSGDLFN